MRASWQPAADIRQLRQRARLLAAIRQFFACREVLEVETPLLCRATGTDPNLNFFSSQFHQVPHTQTLFLQTSPEFAMKRLLAAGSGSIYQICKAFRNGEAGRFHNPEFTLLEWYRLDFTLQQLMDEVAELLLGLLRAGLPHLAVLRISYQQLFKQHTGLDALAFNRQAYRQYAVSRDHPEADMICGEDHALWLDFLFSHCVQNSLPGDTLCLVHGYPAIQSSLARLLPEDTRVAERFEVFINGLELGNGFFELCDADEQESRFDREIAHRQQHGLPAVAKDQLFLAALKAGLPACSGVAIGLDRLLMIASGCDAITQVLAFPVGNA
ncbi:MAG: EF-P lysine aminoacylase EpmA [Methylomonas sp.]|uniref:EF-P lysine aminoacylase EpmA n=1 Tax=Methylomonas sp. TaxID=418 RepID=UPI0025DAC5AA|nr:EF-P lysine aminoacylase EpmA [Methylomonas sp.]MCK9608564.1 EF-P lysine aminoacylase EpmA [Methylomonas sp.]